MADVGLEITVNGQVRRATVEPRLTLSGSLCRCTGYQGILQAVRSAATTTAVAAGTVNQEMR
jgi:aerobic-type carbon monoxide dehydrogenase small subunit (CoxS/CutS family)